MAEIDARSEALQKELLKKANAKQGFEELADEIDALREEKQDLLAALEMYVKVFFLGLDSEDGESDGEE